MGSTNSDKQPGDEQPGSIGQPDQSAIRATAVRRPAVSPYTYQPGQYQPGPYPGGYPPPPPHVYPGYSPATGTPRNGLGIGALVVAILAVVSSISVVGGIVLGIVAVLLRGPRQVKKG